MVVPVYGCLLPYQCLEIGRVHRSARGEGYVSLPDLWERVECRRGMQIDLSCIVTYLGSMLIDDPMSGLWLVVLNEKGTKYADFVLCDMYDTYRLWYVTTPVREFIRELELS